MKGLRIHGIPLHPLLVHFPVSGWSAATLLLVAAGLDAGSAVETAARWCNGVALITGLAAMAAGFIELAALPRDAEVRDAVARHMLLAGSAWSVYLVVLLFQLVSMTYAALPGAIAGFVLLLLAGHAGARLVYPHGLPEHAGPFR